MEDQQVYGCFSISYGFLSRSANLGTQATILCSSELFRIIVLFQHIFLLRLIILLKLKHVKNLVLLLLLSFNDKLNFSILSYYPET